MIEEAPLSRLGKAIWSIFLHEADVAVFRIKLFEGLSGEATLSFYSSGSLIRDSLDDPLVPRGYINGVLRPVAHELQRTPPFARQPFTHMRYELSSEGKVKVDFAYIPEWDSWPGLFMKGVSDVAEEEARMRPRFYKTWLECRARREKEPYQK